MHHDPRFRRGGQAGANDNPATGRIALDTGLSDFFVIEDDVEVFFGYPFKAAE